MYVRTALFALLLLSAGCSRIEESLALGGAGTQPDTPAGTQAAGAAARAGTSLASRIASARMPRRSFANAPDRGDLVAYPSKPVVRYDGAYTWHRADLSEEHALHAIATGHMAITSPSGERLRFRYERHVEHPSGDLTWVGRLEGGQRSDEVVVTFGEKGVFGTIGQSGKAPLRLTMADGVSWLVQTDPSKIAGIDNAATRPRQPDYLLPPDAVTAAGATASADLPAVTAGSPATAAAATSAATTVDVLLGYTAGFAAATNGAPLTRLNNMVEISNQAYANSGLAERVRLVHAMQVGYADNTDNSVALEELTGFKAPSTRTTPATAFSELRAAREQYGADLVSLVRKFNEPENKGCGIAWLIGGGQTGIDRTDEFFGYSVVSDGRDAGTDGKTYFCRDETLAHELGHNMGSQHDNVTAKGDDGVLQANEYGVYPYSFGYKTAAGAGNFYTVMAYGDSGQTAYRIFSNPRTAFCGGELCGSVQADNAQSLGRTIPIIGSFRSEITAPAPAMQFVANDVDADGRSDLLWYSGASLAWWKLDGSSIIGTGGQAASAGNVAASGDFDGDRRVDLISAVGRDLVLMRNTGAGFVPQRISDYPDGWTLVGAGDIDGDSRSDLLWYNGVTVAWWRMSGSVVLTTGGQAAGPGFSVMAVGDLTGDKRADVVLRSGGTEMKLWVAAGDAFAEFGMPVYPGSWTFVGASDLNADGRADLLWRNSTTFAWWHMNGASITSSGGRELADAVMPLATGDFDGDGDSDVVWRLATDSLSLWRSGPGGFSVEALASYPEGWSIIRDDAQSLHRTSRGDHNGDGRSDLIWHNGSTTLAWWHLLGQTVASTGGYGLAPASEALAKGDFTGDGRVDVVWKDNANWLYLAEARDSGFVSTRISTYPEGWVLVGVGDINGDSRSELIWHNGATLAWWQLDKSNVVNTGGQSMGIGSQVLGVGDLNGDGRDDVLWRDGSSNIQLWTASRTGFSLSLVASYPGSWNIAGLGDLDGDQREDILWHNGTTLAWWNMRAHSVVATGGRSMGVGSSVLSVLDVDGSARADVLWRDSSNTLRVWRSLSDGFDDSPISSYPTGWVVVK